MDSLAVQKRIAPVERIHPSMPTPVIPLYVEPIVITPEVARVLLDRVEKGKELPFVYFAFDDQTWLTLGQYQEGVVAYVEKLLAIVQHYGNPELNPPRIDE